MQALQAFALAHPELCAALLWPLVSAILTALFKPRTPEQYAAMPPRLAAALQLLGALGLDPVKATIAIKKIFAGTKPPGPPAVGVVALIVASMLTSGCATLAPREQARAAVLVTAEATVSADHACAEVAIAKHDLALATKCADAYKPARLALIAASVAVDTWDDATSRASVSCAVKHPTAALTELSGEVVKAGGNVPKVVDDALSLASLLSPCTESAK